MRASSSGTRGAWLIVAAVLVLAVACDDDGAPPLGASPIATSANTEATVFPASEGGEEQLFFGLACQDGVLTIVTTLRTVRAALPCDRLPPADVIERFQQEPMEVEIRPGPPGKILLRAAAAGSLEFTVEDVRIEEP